MRHAHPVDGGFTRCLDPETTTEVGHPRSETASRLPATIGAFMIREIAKLASTGDLAFPWLMAGYMHCWESGTIENSCYVDPCEFGDLWESKMLEVRDQSARLPRKAAHSRHNSVTLDSRQFCGSSPLFNARGSKSKR